MPGGEKGDEKKAAVRGGKKGLRKGREKGKESIRSVLSIEELKLRAIDSTRGGVFSSHDLL